MVCVGKELKDHPVPPLVMGRDVSHCPRLLQGGLGHFQRSRGSHSFSGHLCQDITILTPGGFQSGWDSEPLGSAGPSVSEQDKPGEKYLSRTNWGKVNRTNLGKSEQDKPGGKVCEQDKPGGKVSEQDKPGGKVSEQDKPGGK
ncbi:hypothetical protein HGM15179_017755 [Zosterops borbonicus]|uniref:Uncharacterized protein n=1 Tax=Zosterops borbonicus TaxID=364589 RepID=A0A8K1LD01_9PASS|nr:hypothetical protein HGM15179_017755 [Zosterops borbonicus]